MHARHDRVVDDLRDRIAHLERGARSRPRNGLPLGIQAVDEHLPDGGLTRGALHEIIGGGADLPHGAAAALFAAVLLGRQKGPVLWVLRARDLFAPGLSRAGLHPDRLIYAETIAETAMLPDAEDGARHKGLAGVVAETARLSRRDAAWMIRAFRDKALPLFGAADTQERQFVSEMPEAPFTVKPAVAGREVVDDYAATGFSLKAHPVTFLRGVLGRRGAIPTADLAHVRDGRRVRTAGLVLVRQRPGSAKGVMFATLEDETGSSNLIVWPSLFEQFRRIVFTASMVGVDGKLQREGEVIHVIADRLVDLSASLRRVGERDAPFPIPAGAGDEVRRGGAADQRGPAAALQSSVKEDFNPDLRIDRGIKVRPRNFR